MDIENYIPRIADSILEKRLKAAGAIQLRGPKWCGKTSTALKVAKSAIFMQYPDEGPSLLALADSKPQGIFQAKQVCQR